MVCFYRRRDISSSLIALADKHASESVPWGGSACPSPSVPACESWLHSLFCWLASLCVADLCSFTVTALCKCIVSLGSCLPMGQRETPLFMLLACAYS